MNGEAKMNLNGLPNYLVTVLIIYFFWRINAITRIKIDRWAKDRGVDVLSKVYVPWHWYYPLCGGFHPANFRVTARNAQGEKEIYWIIGGGFLWLNDEIRVTNKGGKAHTMTNGKRDQFSDHSTGPTPDTTHLHKILYSPLGIKAFVVTWMICASVASYLLAQKYWVSYYRIANHGVSEKAIVLQLLPENHNLVRYSYKFGDKTFEGMRGSFPPNKSFNNLKVGEEVTIYFDPQHPETSLLGDPKAIFKDETIAVMIGGIAFPLLILLTLFFGNREISRKQR
ncbi:DUF3592 domain-containing protein [Geomesophilobacter sediminis]|uniref:DUF3592 domain-containing protein n=1 Tax=Geomesophilobacter sediminis TaxID=2798584 RepID=A0A8J7J5T2_9BACT|nr:DUF3592 domain-containing protein [Geomesophilobacter sediminis]MBJ6726358.1 hypothetical protein [Geomesophilobacter sediminis]